jgi:ketosteroid isomerase-like protein
MKLSLILSALIIVLALISISCERDPCKLSDEDVEAIKKTDQALIRALLAGDWTTAVEQYAESGVYMPANAPMQRGRTIIKAHLALVDSLTQFTFVLLQLDGRGPIAYSRGNYKLTAYVQGVEDPISHGGKRLSIFRKQRDGSWLIAMDMFNPDAPFPR